MGRIEVICGSMFSGKTEELIRRLERLKYANQIYKVFKPEIDTRNKKNIIKSHSKGNKAETVSKAKEILDLSTDVDVIGIDEAQFFSEDLVDVCNTLANGGTRVIVAGLDMDFSGKPFGPMPNLMAIAEEVTKVMQYAQKQENLLCIATEKERTTMWFYLEKRMSMSLFQKSFHFKNEK